MMRMEYLRFSSESGEILVRRDSADMIRYVEGVIFDCDGVLIDVRDSYNRAISKSVSYIFECITGRDLPERLISNEIIHLFRRTGGFNNDWDTVYGILMFMLSHLPEESRKHIYEGITAKNEGSPYRRLMAVKEYMSKEPCMLDDALIEETIKRLREFTGLLDSSGRRSVDDNLLRMYGRSRDFRKFYTILREFLYGEESVGRSIIATVFEEFFCGASLFRKVYGISPQFNNGSGLIGNGRLIIKPETLDSLISLLGRRSLGIASGSRREPAEYILNGLIEKFNSKALIFLDDVDEAERSLGRCLRKPHPFSLLRASEGLEGSRIIYVGDSVEDVLMAREASRRNGKFIFAGVYRYTALEEDTLKAFLEHKCDMILPTVNELPLILEELRRMMS